MAFTGAIPRPEVCRAQRCPSGSSFRRYLLRWQNPVASLVPMQIACWIKPCFSNVFIAMSRDPRLSGGGCMSFSAALSHLTATSADAGLPAFASDIDAAWVKLALELGGVGKLRKRELPAESVVWLVFGMASFREHAMADLVRRLDLVLPSPNSTIGRAHRQTSRVNSLRLTVSLSRRHCWREELSGGTTAGSRPR